MLWNYRQHDSHCRTGNAYVMCPVACRKKRVHFLKNCLHAQVFLKQENCLANNGDGLCPCQNTCCILQQTLGPWWFSFNDTSSICSYQCPSHRGDLECYEDRENVNVLGEKVSHSFPSSLPCQATVGLPFIILIKSSS